mmetsp:Transcript_5158/g.14193  ORF Transcript_5158/g.14193 Transcript_5158/m.14193 type:complete len:203 (-) Transcript_5158:91-699(-)
MFWRQPAYTSGCRQMPDPSECTAAGQGARAGTQGRRLGLSGSWRVAAAARKARAGRSRPTDRPASGARSQAGTLSTQPRRAPALLPAAWPPWPVRQPVRGGPSPPLPTRSLLRPAASTPPCFVLAPISCLELAACSTQRVGFSATVPSGDAAGAAALALARARSPYCTATVPGALLPACEVRRRRILPGTRRARPGPGIRNP